MALGMNIPDIGQWLKHFHDQLPILWRLVTGGTFVMGMFFALKSIYGFKEYGEMRVMMSAQTDVRQPLGYLFIAVGLMWAPYFASQMLDTVFLVKAPAPFIYHAKTQITKEFKEGVQILGDIFELIGFIGFIRGWLLLAQSSQRNSQPGTFRKGLVYMVGGICAMNIFGTWNLIRSMFGF